MIINKVGFMLCCIQQQRMDQDCSYTFVEGLRVMDAATTDGGGRINSNRLKMVL